MWFSMTLLDDVDTSTAPRVASDSRLISCVGILIRQSDTTCRVRHFPTRVRHVTARVLYSTRAIRRAH